MKDKIICLIFCLAMISFFGGCGRPPLPSRVILITLDTHRADYLSFVNPEKVSTPNLDALARQGIYFDRAYSLIPITLPSHASIFFSEPPYLLKNYNNGQELRPKRNRPSLVNYFKKNKYRTAAFVSLGVLASRFGLNEGFEFYEDSFPADRWYLHAEEVNERVFPWLETYQKEPFFLWIHYSDPHDPYAPPASPNDLKVYHNDKLILETCLNKYRTYNLPLTLKPGRNLIRLEVNNFADPNPDHFLARLDRLKVLKASDGEEIRADLIRGWYIRREDSIFFFKSGSLIEIQNGPKPQEVIFHFRGKLLLPVEAIRQQYRREIEYMDWEIGRLINRLKELNLYHRTLFVLAGDHGEGLGEYLNTFGDPHIGHIHYLYDVYMKVPLIICYPEGLKGGKRITTPVTLMDIAPTILTLMNWEKLPQQQGRNLLKVKSQKEISIFMETYRPESIRDRFALLEFPWHLILTPEDNRLEIYNLATDPEEKNNLAEIIDHQNSLSLLKAKLEEFARKALKEKIEIAIDKKTEEMLRSLGYLR
ncbi:MAG: sulfatase-like hydrolase/transferase [Candidatus Aminicenantes bacterium]|nr:sulfatase-like hydrolase/transferase [Candidatus Aminicenantes bacterium]